MTGSGEERVALYSVAGNSTNAVSLPAQDVNELPHSACCQDYRRA